MNQFDIVSLILFTSCLCCTAHWSQEADVCESVSLRCCFLKCTLYHMALGVDVATFVYHPHSRSLIA